MIRLILMFGAVVLGLVGSVGLAAAEGKTPTILIMAEDGNYKSIPRGNRISTRVLNEIAGQLDARGYDVYDETAVTLRTGVQGRSRRSDAELVDVAKSVTQPPIDVVVFFEVFGNVTRKTYQNELRVRTVGRLLSVADGRRLGSWEAKMPEDRDQPWLLPNRCFPEGAELNRNCLLEAVGDDARILAQEVGAIIAEKLETHLKGANPAVAATPDDGLKRGFHLVFDGFTARDYRDIEEYLVVFSGYLDHRPTRTAHLHQEVWYETTIATAKLERNLHKMMELLQMPYVLNFSGNTYTVKAKNLRRAPGASAARDNGKW